MSDVTERLITMLRERDARGLQKYGTTLDRSDLTPEQWIDHAIEEALDFAGYLMALKRELPLRNVVTLDEYRPHWIGPCICDNCGRKWIGVVIAGAEHSGLECPDCGKHEGRPGPI